MPRAKKDGTHISFYLRTDVVERLRAYANVNGQTMTIAMERLLTKALNDADGLEMSRKESQHTG